MRRARDDCIGRATDDAEVASTVKCCGDVGAIGGECDAICMVEGDFDGSIVALAQSFGRVTDELPQVDSAILISTSVRKNQEV